ncbi:hypothetical protein AGQ53_21615, partial [Salmonella enterica subsp. enterica]
HHRRSAKKKVNQRRQDGGKPRKIIHDIPFLMWDTIKIAPRHKKNNYIDSYFKRGSPTAAYRIQIVSKIRMIAIRTT